MADSLLMVGNFLSASVGTRGVCEELAERLANDGWLIVTTSKREKRAARLVDMISTTWRNRQQYRVAHVDVFSGPSFAWAEAVTWTLRRAHKPYVLTLHGGGLPAFAQRWSGRVRDLLRPAAAVTVPSPYLADQMKPFRADLRLIPNGIEIRQYPYRVLKCLRPRIVWLRAFHRIYNPALAVRALAWLRTWGCDATLAMIGPDKSDGSLEETRAAIQELALTPYVQLEGAVPKNEVGHRISEGDIFLNTSTIDNTPVSILEAMACGLAIVSTNVGGISHLLKHERNALLTPSGDSLALASAVRRLLADPSLAARLSQNARHDALTFDWSHIVPRWCSLLRSLA
jgi:glycosyltransferase involved in cell wall biosynthesis